MHPYAKALTPKSKKAICELCKEEFTWDRGYNVKYCKKDKCQKEKIRVKNLKAKMSARQFAQDNIQIQKNKKKRVTKPTPYVFKSIVNTNPRVKSYNQLLREAKKREKENEKTLGVKLKVQFK